MFPEQLGPVQTLRSAQDPFHFDADPDPGFALIKMDPNPDPGGFSKIY